MVMLVVHDWCLEHYIKTKLLMIIGNVFRNTTVYYYQNLVLELIKISKGLIGCLIF